MQDSNSTFINQISDVKSAEWDSLHDGTNPFISHAFLNALEQSGCVKAETGWQPHHVLIRGDRGSLQAAMPLYFKGHSMGEYVFDHAWADAYERAGGRYYPKLLSAIPFTPATGPRLLANKKQDQSALFKQAALLCEAKGLSSLHLNFLTEDDEQLLSHENFLIRHDQQYHWQNANYQSFNDFLSTLTSRKRKQIIKERRTALENNVSIEWLSGRDIKQNHFDDFYTFYTDTGLRKWGQTYLNREFFERISDTMADKMLLIMCKRGEKYIAGALNFIGGNTLYGRHWGALESHPGLHFEVCYYQAIEYAILHKLKFVEAGAQGPHKIARGYVPIITKSAHWFRDAGFREAVDRYLRMERSHVAEDANYAATFAPFKKQ